MTAAQKLIAAVVGFGLAVSVSPARAEDRFGAIAIAPSTLSYGTATDAPTREAAAAAAMSKCGEADCEVRLWFRNACGAVALGPTGYGTGWGVDRTVAGYHAIEVCGQYSTGCRVDQAVCNSRIHSDSAAGGEP